MLTPPDAPMTATEYGTLDVGDEVFPVIDNAPYWMRDQPLTVLAKDDDRLHIRCLEGTETWQRYRNFRIGTSDHAGQLLALFGIPRG